MGKIQSDDGTTIVYERLGQGPPVVLVSGASCTRAVHAPLAELLAADFTVYNYDRRGRGDSDDTLPSSVEREIEDLRHVIAATGAPAAVFGNSSGGVLALRAAASGVPITRLALWEPPFRSGPDAPELHRRYVARLTELLEAGRRGDAMASFMTFIGVPDAFVDQMRHAPMWPGMEAIAHTLLHDAAIMGDLTVPAGVAASVDVPTLVVTGSETGAWAEDAALALAAALPHPQHRTLPGQDHNVAWEVLAPVLREFLAA